MKELPNISVVLCTYNGARYLSEQLESIFLQTCLPFEVIVSDDGSTDATMQLLRSFQQRSPCTFKIYENAITNGVKNNFGRALALSSGAYIALADQDDIWAADKLSRFAEKIVATEHGVPALYFSDPEMIDSNGQSLNQTFSRRARIRLPVSNHWKFLLLGNFVPGCSIVFDRRLLHHILPIPVEAILHDWWITLLFSLVGEIYRVEYDTMKYRLHESNAQGMGSLSGAMAAGRSSGLLRVASNNLTVTLGQAACAKQRLEDAGEAYPRQLDELCLLLERDRFARPAIMLRYGLRRGNIVKMAISLLGAVFANAESQSGEERKYR